MIPDRPWLLCAALAEEADLLIPQLSEIEMVGRRRAYAGRLGDQPALLLITGMGHINAAQAATAALERFAGIAGVISLGCAGAFAQSGLGMGQTALADEMVLADMGGAHQPAPARPRDRQHPAFGPRRPQAVQPPAGGRRAKRRGWPGRIRKSRAEPLPAWAWSAGMRPWPGSGRSAGG